MTRLSVLPEKQKGCFFFTISLKEVNHVQEKGVPIFSFRYLPGRRLLPVPVWIIFLPRDETMASRFSGDRHRRTGYCRMIRMPDCFGNDCCRLSGRFLPRPLAGQRRNRSRWRTDRQRLDHLDIYFPAGNPLRLSGRLDFSKKAKNRA